MNKVKTILFASNLDENSRSFFSVAAVLAAQMNTRVIVLHVQERLQESYEGIAVGIFGARRWGEILHEYLQSGRESDLKNDSEKQIIGAALAQLGRESERVVSGFNSTECEFIIKEGDIVEEIVKLSEVHKCDMVIMGSSKSSSSGITVGPYIKSVVKKMKIPVVIAPHQFEN
jgi:nucleotide-binding universal stress UspA family protein